MPDDSIKERLAAARAGMAERAKAKQDARELAEAERFDLLTRFEKETGGEEGIDFAIVDATRCNAGFVVVRLGDAVLFKAFQKSEMNEVDVDAFVLPCVVHPDKDEYRKIAAARPGVAQECAAKLAVLFGIKEKGEQGK